MLLYYVLSFFTDDVDVIFCGDDLAGDVEEVDETIVMSWAPQLPISCSCTDHHWQPIQLNLPIQWKSVVFSCFYAFSILVFPGEKLSSDVSSLRGEWE